MTLNSDSLNRSGSARAHRPRCIVLALAFMFSLAFGALAQVRAQTPATSDAEPLTLTQAVDLALQSNPMIRATAASRKAADARLEQARALRFPILQFNETFTASNNPVFVFGSLLEQGRFGQKNFDPRFLNNPDSLVNIRTALTFRVPVFDQRQAETRIKQATIGQQQVDSNAEQVRQRIRFDVIRAYYGQLVADSNREVADEAVKLASADVKRSRDLFETGMVVRSDMLAAEVQLSEFVQQRIQAEGDIAVAKATLNTAMGIDINASKCAIGQMVDRDFNVAMQDELIARAMQQRPELAQLRLNLDASKERTRGVRGEFLPRVEAYGAFGISSHGLGSGSSDYTVGASVTFSIFDRGRSARVSEARANEQIADAERESAANQIRLEVVRAYQSYIAARERVAVAAKAVDQAREALRIIRDRYQIGLSNITEVLRAETSFVRARMSLVVARFDHQIGYANVLLATGSLTDVKEFAP